MKQFNREFFRDFWGLVKPYWTRSDEKWSARGLLALVMALNLTMVFISYRITEWYNTFWNDLQQYDAAAAWHQILVFTVLVVPYIVAAVYQAYLMQMLQIRWRRWLTKRYLDSWLASGTYYHLQVIGEGTDNPDQRIADDLASFSSQTLGLAIGLLSSVTTLLAFLAMLWGLSSQVPITWDGGKFFIPGYLVWTAVVYAFGGTVITALIGRPLIRLNFEREHYQADFRFSMVRLRENSESVALYSGETREREHFLARFTQVFDNYRRIMLRSRRLNWWVSGYGQAAIIFPVLVSMPAYFAKLIQLGAIMQISSAFGQVQSALSFIVNSYTDLASWHAVVDRLRFFEHAMDEIKAIREKHYKMIRRDGPRFRVSGLGVRLPSGRVLLRDLNLSLDRGDRLIVMGPSGSGKSTLIRALAGIWPYSEGGVELPAKDAVLFLPQRPYLPLGTLRDVLLYPAVAPETGDAELRSALELAGLPALAGSLAEDRLWAQVLSLGEQQRLAFARVFLHRPAWIFMDEATSALDEPSEGRLYSALVRVLPETAIVSVGHRSSLVAYHGARLSLQGEGGWAVERIESAGKA